ncbi:type 3 dihydrofolate reductase [Gilliamella sp. B2776]|uniref:type 3 dihydrofolate reductase n=1 Tax=unclassified Gilliamella TaxID=2685620 RepID=UPI00279C2716|nr:type 3 dihydrofolate reductase [Gilliamella sp. B2779]MCX8655169.1 type 3 dihydrofolate reductase [Gilliamella sp. B2737]MCX8655941.1 type 3 dihydrofolate reductase [Gilliamella sp. B2894]MCX8664045.1 type 3 dihydrofolate reductase [Gilliamella sp. B2887]MCX8691288.1 type 3 dihydrofolate reductase [Gilliamella sp. B2776]MCX8694514.1 type 3 dihydrofolate reductase [Gilliamella sp. B2881]MCX8695113.1 type 3 dihydrofolate reductase [Gilliamella sp. B2828]MCX8698083.1 type 3 dihydrofolate red
MILSVIVAMAHHRVIGQNNQMPWHLPADLAWFKKNTLHKPVIMGRKTFESIGRPLPNRHNIIVSRQAVSDLNANPNISWVQSIEAALSLVQAQHVEEAFVIGGGNIYQQVLPLINRLYLTHIDADLQGDTYFPDYLPEQWQVIYQQDHQADEQNSYPYQFEILERK